MNFPHRRVQHMLVDVLDSLAMSRISDHMDRLVGRGLMDKIRDQAMAQTRLVGRDLMDKIKDQATPQTSAKVGLSPLVESEGDFREKIRLSC